MEESVPLMADQVNVNLSRLLTSAAKATVCPANTSEISGLTIMFTFGGCETGAGVSALRHPVNRKANMKIVKVLRNQGKYCFMFASPFWSEFELSFSFNFEGARNNITGNLIFKSDCN